MQHCAKLIISYPSMIFSSILSIINNIIQIYFWIVSIVCAKIAGFMYSNKIKLVSKKNQMCGHLQRVNLKKGVLMCKYLYNKKNNHWHLNHFVCDFTTLTRTMWFNTTVTMSGKLKLNHRMAKIVGHIT